MGKPDALSRREDHAEGIEDNNKEVVVITPDKIRTTILIMDEGDSLKQKIFNTTCLLSEADVQRVCKKNTICKECDGTLTDNLDRLYSGLKKCPNVESFWRDWKIVEEQE